MNSKKCPKIVTARTEGTRKRGQAWIRWTDEFLIGFEDTGLRNGQTVARDRKERGKILLNAKVHNGL
jgi:hypothetical protein